MKLSNVSKNVLKAYNLAKSAHEGQVDKGGKPYIEHPVAVASLVFTDEEKTVALLHDVVEDTPITLSDLQAQGFTTEVVTAVDCLTKRQGEALSDYLNRVKSNTLATTVKIADLTHNSDIRRIPSPTEKDFARVARYKKEIAYLQDTEATLFEA